MTGHDWKSHNLPMLFMLSMAASQSSSVYVESDGKLCPPWQDGSQVDVVSQALVRIVKDDPRNWLSLMHFEKEFCFDCDWRRIDLNASDKVLP